MIFARAQSLPLSIVVADPTGGSRLLATLRGLRVAGISLPCEVIGVVGGLNSGVVPRLRAEFPLVALYQAWGEENLGALYALGCAAAAGKQLLLLDGTVQVSGQTIAGLVLFMEQGPWVAMVAPRVVDSRGEEVVPGRPFPSVRNAFAEFERGRTTRSQHLTGPRLRNSLDSRITTPKEVDAVVSGCCLMKRQAIEAVGALATGFTAGGETLDWCRRARQGGWSIFYHPGHSAPQLEDDLDEARRAARGLAASCGYIRRHRGILALWALKLLLALPIARGFIFGGAALIPGRHRENARLEYLRASYGLAALQPSRRAGGPRPA